MRIVHLEDGTEFAWWDSVCFEAISLSTALAVGSIAATLAGAGVSYMASQQQASAVSKQNEYNAHIAANNQKTADAAAADAQVRGENAAAQKAQQVKQLQGRQKASLAANGVDVNSGSSVDVLSDTAAAGEYDELTIRNNTARESAGFTNQGINYRNQASLDEAASADALAGGALKGAASLIGGAGSVANTWYSYKYGTRQAGPGTL